MNKATGIPTVSEAKPLQRHQCGSGVWECSTLCRLAQPAWCSGRLLLFSETMLRIFPAILAAFVLSTSALAQEGEAGGDWEASPEPTAPSPAEDVPAQSLPAANPAPVEEKDPWAVPPESGGGIHMQKGWRDPDPQATEREKQAAEAAVQRYLEEQRRGQDPSDPPPWSLKMK
jgi:hypothetical protein